MSARRGGFERGGGGGERFSDMTNPNATISAFSPTELGRTRLLLVVVIAVKCIAVITRERQGYYCTAVVFQEG